MKNTAYYLYRPHPYFGAFYPRKVLALIADTTSISKYLPDSKQQFLARQYFPDGLTPHGLSMLLSYSKNNESFLEPVIEMIFEQVRRLHFPNAPSRFTSLFAAKTIEDAEQWSDLLCGHYGNAYGQVPQSIWEVEYETDAKLYDASLLNVDPSLVEDGSFSCFLTLDNANRYWSGELTGICLPELLIPPPVTVVRRLT